MLAVICSDPNAHPPQPEAQILSQIVRAYEWSHRQYGAFGRPFLNRQGLRELFAGTCRNFLQKARTSLAPPKTLVLKHPAMLPHLKSFQDLLPTASVITMVRDPRDQICSELEIEMATSGQRSVKKHAEKLLRWCVDTDNIEKTMVVRYEDLVQDFRAVKTRLETELNLTILLDPDKPWPDISSLKQFRNKPSWNENYGKRVTTNSVGRYRHDLTADEIRIIETLCCDLMSKFGYSAVTS